MAPSTSTAPRSPASIAAIAMDGPAGAGKSTVARQVARRLGFFLLDTGAIYRSVALCAVRAQLPLSDGQALGAVARTLAIRFDPEGRVWLGDENVSEAIRAPAISQAASAVSAHREVRDALLGLQRQLAARGRCVVEGRDIGTVVLPWAPLKIFLTASPEVRARRRYQELVDRGAKVTLAETLAEIAERDDRDQNRAAAPLRCAEDALYIDTSDLNLESVIDRIVQVAKERLPAISLDADS